MGFRKMFAALLSLLVLTTNVSFAQGTKAPPNLVTFKKDLFEQSLTNALAPKLMGYQYVLIKDGKVVSEKFGGKARTGADGEMNMTPTTPINMGSLMKFVTGTALLNLMERPALTGWNKYKGQSVEANLDRRIWAEFPKLWLDQIPPVEGNSVRSINFRQLVSHRSGFDNQWYPGGKKTNRPFLGYLKDGFDAAQFDKWEYANVNFVLTGFLLPLVEKKIMKSDLDIETGGMSKDEADKYIQNKLGLRMDAMMRERIWSKMSPKFNPSCDASNALKGTAAYGYSSKSDKDGDIDSSIDASGHCTGTGGYYMAARDLANYAAHFSASDIVVSKATRDLMFDGKTKKDDQLVWSVVQSDSWMNTNFQTPSVAWSDGRAANNSGGVMLRLPQNYYLVIFANSPDMGSWDLYNAGVAAFKSGMQHNFD